MTSPSLLAVEIGGTKLQVALATSPTRITHQFRYQVNPAQGAAGIREQLQHAIDQALAITPIDACAAGFGGPVLWQTGRIAKSHQISGWSEFELGDWLQNLTQCPTAVDNDANVAALGEACHGAGRGKRAVFYVTLGSGVGGGYVLDQKIFHAAPPGEVEVGHLRLNKDGALVEQYCSGWAVDEQLRRFSRQHPHAPLSEKIRQIKGTGQARVLNEALAKNDPDAAELWQGITDNLAFALSHVVHLLHPDIIVLGGGLSLLRNHLLDPVRDRLPSYLMEVFLPGPDIVLAQLTEDAVPIGALELAARLLPTSS